MGEKGVPLALGDSGDVLAISGGEGYGSAKEVAVQAAVRVKTGQGALPTVEDVIDLLGAEAFGIDRGEASKGKELSGASEANVIAKPTPVRKLLGE